MRKQNVIAELEKRRVYRGQFVIDRSVGGAVGEIEREIRAAQKRVGRAEAAIGDVLPASLAPLCAGMSVRGGVLTLRASDSAAKFRLSQWLRGGGDAEIKRRARIAVRFIKVR